MGQRSKSRIVPTSPRLGTEGLSHGLDDVLGAGR